MVCLVFVRKKMSVGAKTRWKPGGGEVVSAQPSHSATFRRPSRSVTGPLAATTSLLFPVITLNQQCPIQSSPNQPHDGIFYGYLTSITIFARSSLSSTGFNNSTQYRRITLSSVSLFPWPPCLAHARKQEKQVSPHQTAPPKALSLFAGR